MLFLSSKRQKEELTWSIQQNPKRASFGFAKAFRFRLCQDLSTVARGMEEGVAMCTPRYIAGSEHARRILIQADEYWKRDKKLARNKSIDLLMRITCQSQISTALKLSEVSDAKQMGLFGLVENSRDAERSASKLLALGGIRDDSLLKLDPRKELFLKKFHNLPKWCTGNQVLDLLEEKSVLLVFSK